MTRDQTLDRLALADWQDRGRTDDALPPLPGDVNALRIRLQRQHDARPTWPVAILVGAVIGLAIIGFIELQRMWA